MASSSSSSSSSYALTVPGQEFALNSALTVSMQELHSLGTKGVTPHTLWGVNCIVDDFIAFPRRSGKWS